MCHGRDPARDWGVTALVTAKGWFTTATELELQSIQGLGFRPVAVVAWWAGQSIPGTTRGNHGGIGFWTETGTAAVAWASADGETATVDSAAGRRRSASRVGWRRTSKHRAESRCRVLRRGRVDVSLRPTTVEAVGSSLSRRRMTGGRVQPSGLDFVE